MKKQGTGTLWWRPRLLKVFLLGLLAFLQFFLGFAPPAILSSSTTPITPLSITKKDTIVPSLRLAVCHKTLFGKIDLTRVAHWAQYHHDLGFDTIFIWYLPEMVHRPGFVQLKKLPFVQLLLNSVGTTRTNRHGVARMDPDLPGNQKDSEKWCLQHVAKDYDLVLNSDADEYLYFSQHVSVREFVETQGQNISWWSFGKQMYTVKHEVIESNQSFYAGLNKNAFTAGPFCVRRLKSNIHNRGSPYCPYLNSRSKVMVNPAIHDKVDIHGHNVQPDPPRGIVHFSTEVAHLKEWPYLLEPVANVKRRPPRNFTVQQADEVNIHDLTDGHKRNANGTFDMMFDAALEPWLEYVSHRRKREKVGSESKHVAKVGWLPSLWSTTS